MKFLFKAHCIVDVDDMNELFALLVDHFKAMQVDPDNQDTKLSRKTYGISDMQIFELIKERDLIRH